MSRYKDSNKYKIYGEDAILAARFDKYLDATLRNCRADYLKALSKRKQREIPYEDLPDDVRADIQRGVDKSYDRFVSTVARNRGLFCLAILQKTAGIAVMG